MSVSEERARRQVKYARDVTRPPFIIGGHRLRRDNAVGPFLSGKIGRVPSRPFRTTRFPGIYSIFFPSQHAPRQRRPPPPSGDNRFPSLSRRCFHCIGCRVVVVVVRPRLLRRFSFIIRRLPPPRRRPGRRPTRTPPLRPPPPPHNVRHDRRRPVRPAHVPPARQPSPTARPPVTAIVSVDGNRRGVRPRSAAAAAASASSSVEQRQHR